MEKTRYKENLSQIYFVPGSLRLQLGQLLHLLLVSGHSSPAKPLYQNISQRAWPQNLLKLVLIPKHCNNRFPITENKFQETEIYFRNCWPMQCLRGSLLVNIYPRRTQGTRKHATVSAKSKSSFTPHVERIYVEIIKTVIADEKCKYAQSSEDTLWVKNLQTVVDLQLSRRLQRQKVEFAK